MSTLIGPLGSRIIRYVRNGWTGKSNAYCPLLYGEGHNNVYLLSVSDDISSEIFV